MRDLLRGSGQGFGFAIGFAIGLGLVAYLSTKALDSKIQDIAGDFEQWLNGVGEQVAPTAGAGKVPGHDDT